MPRYLFRVQYTLSDASITYEPVCVDAVTVDAAVTAVEAATDRYTLAVSATRTVTLVTTV